MIVDNLIFENKIEENMLGLIKSLNIDELNQVLSSLNLDNKSIVIVKGN